MKKIVSFLLIAITAVSMLTGCEFVKKNEVDKDEIKVGIVETRSNKEKSRILFLDEDLNEIGSVKLKEASVGTNFDTPVVVDGDLYIIPQGLATKKDAKKVIQMDLSDLEITEHKIDKIALTGVAANDKYVFTCNNLNGITYITGCDKVSGEETVLSLEGVYVLYVFYAEGRLYAFAETHGDEGTEKVELLIYDDNLNLLDTVDITSCGQGTNKAIFHDGKLLFTCIKAPDGKEAKNVNVFDPADKSLSSIELTQGLAWDLAVHNNKLYVSHFDIVTHTGGGVSVYDFETGKAKYMNFNHGVEQFQISDGKIYVLNHWKIYVYDADSMKLLNTKEIQPMDDDYSYLSNMFTI